MRRARHLQLERTVRAERRPRPLHERPHGEDLLLRGEDPRVEARRHEELADHPPQALGLVGDRVEVGCAPHPGLIRIGPQLGGKRSDARQRGLEVVGHAAKEVGLHAGQPVQLVRLPADLGVEERVLERRPRVLPDEGQQCDLGRRRGRGAPPTARRGSRPSRSLTATSATAKAPHGPSTWRAGRSASVTDAQRSSSSIGSAGRSSSMP